MQEGEPPPEGAVGGEGDHSEGVAGAELENSSDDLCQSSVGEGQGDYDRNGLAGEEAGVDGAEDDGREAEGSQTERGWVRGFHRCDFRWHSVSILGDGLAFCDPILLTSGETERKNFREFDEWQSW